MSVKRTSPQRRLLGDEANLRVAEASVTTTTNGFAEIVEALFLAAAGVSEVLVSSHNAEHAVISFDDEQTVIVATRMLSKNAVPVDVDYPFVTTGARAFAEGSLAALRTLREIAKEPPK